MNSESAITLSLIAPCGMNCGICMAHLREKKQCAGCLGSDEGKPAHCVQCRIKNCAYLKETTTSGLCIDCAKFPCARMKQLDRRYRTKYNMSMIENLQAIQAIGMQAFIKKEQARWACSHCGGVICVHSGVCHDCGESQAKRTLSD